MALRTDIDILASEPAVYHLHGYHTTLLDNIPSILKFGLVPGFLSPAGQQWLGEYSGKGIYTHLDLPLHEIDNGYDTETGEPWLAVLELKVDVLAENLVPDEEFGEPHETKNIVDQRSPVVIGRTIKPSNIVAIHLPDTEFARGLGNLGRPTKFESVACSFNGEKDDFLKEAIKLLAFPFLADPPVPYHQKYKGIIEYPGFHTSSSFDIAATYAIGRIEQSFEKEDEEGVHYVTDYPVVVALDMSGYEKQTDYDAEKFVKESFEVQLDELIKEIGEDASDEDIIDKIQEYIDHSDFDQEMQDSPLGYIFEETFMHFVNPLSTLIDYPNAAQIVRDYAKTKSLPKDLLMDAAQQYRYTQDVDEHRISAVYYITPVASDEEMLKLDWDDPEYEELEEKWAGFDIPGMDDLYGGYFSPSQTKVYEDASVPTDNIEYHGTTLSRLLQAAPFLAGQLPDPPSPPYRS